MLVIVDIDGTIADWSARRTKAGRQPDKADLPAYKKWLNKLQPTGGLLKDPVIKGVQEVIGSLRGQTSPITLVYLTGRSEQYRMETVEWLRKFDFFPGPLIMRDYDDYRSASSYKESVIKQIVKNRGDKLENVIVFDDDHDGDCASMYRKHGWTHLKVMVNVCDETQKLSSTTLKTSSKKRQPSTVSLRGKSRS